MSADMTKREEPLMLSKVRRRITYANIAMTLALVFAMGGGAFASKHFLITSIKQISPKAQKQLAVKLGKSGPSGPAGLQGPAGPQGPAGANGKDGVNGKDGASGESVSSAEVKTGEAACGKLGGSKFVVGGKETFACNGSPWTAKGTLPQGASERGQWGYGGTAPVIVIASISFPIPLAAPLGENEVHFIGLEEGSKEPKEAQAIKNGECTGTWEEPGAASGNLCVFLNPQVVLGPAELSISNSEGSSNSAGVSGALLVEADFSGSGSVAYGGSWVVTA